MSATTGLRGVAVLIAALGAIDPIWTRIAAVEPAIAIRIIESPLLDLPAGSSTRRAVALAAAERIRSGLGKGASVALMTPGQGSVCPDAGACVVIGDGPVDRSLTAGADVVGAVDVSAALSPNVAIAAIELPVGAPLSGTALLRVRLRADAMRGTSTIAVADQGVVVGTASHEWSAGGATEATIDVPWTPLEAGPRRLQVTVDGPEADVTRLDNTADVAVDVSADPWSVLVEEPEATWNGTFVRRVLEADLRFSVQSRARLAPGLTLARGGLQTLGGETLEEARAVVVTAPDSLPAVDVDRLERYVRVRGGSLVLPLDRRPSGPISRLLPTVLNERRDAEPHRVGDVLASEVLTFQAGPGVQVLDSLDGQPVVVSRAMGRGRVVVSGALDAWRYRRGDRFARYWASVIADAALATPPAVEVALTPSVATPYQEIALTVARHAMESSGGGLTAAAVLRCEEAQTTVRLWPTARLGTFSGRVIAPASGACEVEASIAGRVERRAIGRLLVVPEMRPLTEARATLASALPAHGAFVVPAGREEELIARVRALLPGDRAPRETRPMRSPWWLIPFAGCLSLEWWASRRRGGR